MARKLIGFVGVVVLCLCVASPSYALFGELWKKVRRSSTDYVTPVKSNYGVRFGTSVYLCSTEPTSDNQTIVCDNQTGVWVCCWDNMTVVSTSGGDITAVFGDTTGDVSALTAASGDSLDMTNGDSSIPCLVKSDCTSTTLMGRCCVDSNDGILYFGDGVSSVSMANPFGTAVDPAEMASSDFGPFTFTGGSATMDTDSITAAAIATGAVGSDEIDTGAVNAAEIATNAVGADEIAANAVGASEIAAGAVDTEELAATAVAAGTYRISTITVDEDGRITFADNGTAEGNAYICDDTPSSDNQTLVCTQTEGVWSCCWGDVPRDGDFVLGGDDYFDASVSYYSKPCKLDTDPENEAVCKQAGVCCQDSDNTTASVIYFGNGSIAVRVSGSGGSGGTATDFSLPDNETGQFGTTGNHFSLGYSAGDDQLQLLDKDDNVILYWTQTGAIGMAKTSGVPGTYLLYERNGADQNGSGISGPIFNDTLDEDVYFAFPHPDNQTIVVGQHLEMMRTQTIDSKVIWQMSNTWNGAINYVVQTDNATFDWRYCHGGIIEMSNTTTKTMVPYDLSGTGNGQKCYFNVINSSGGTIRVDFQGLDGVRLNGADIGGGDTVSVSSWGEVSCTSTDGTTWSCVGDSAKCTDGGPTS